jgi:glycosyltransferase involved in cell wall biosynthesis
MHNPFFSIITVTYNSSKYVRDAIDSVLASSFIDFELIIGDDCSTDNTWEIIQEYKDSKIIKYRNETNFREYPNRNKALSLAKGEWVLFIDGDDLIYPHALSFIASMIEKSNDVGMLLMRWYRNNMIYPILISPRDFYLEKYLGDSFLNTAFTNVVFNRKVLLENGGIPSEYSFGDDVIRLQLALTCKMMIISDQLTFWRETPSQASQVKNNLLTSYFEKKNVEFAFLKKSFVLGIFQENEYNYSKYLLTKRIIIDSLNFFLKFKFKRSILILSKYKREFEFKKPYIQINLPFAQFSPSNLLNFDKSYERLKT